MGKTAGSLWAQTTDIGYMGREGRGDSASHAWLSERLASLYADKSLSLLDCGVMSGVTYERLRGAGLSMRYTGIDINPTVIEGCTARFPEAAWLQMSVMDLALPTGAFDVVNGRHILEHLPYYDTAVRELFRVSREHVVICFFQAPRDPEALLRRDTAEGYIWLNRYAPGPFEELLRKLSSDVEVVDLSDGGLKPNRIYFCTK
jgi:ubiquinone/menaquinone biosynthesis C-methylase UbiE